MEKQIKEMVRVLTECCNHCDKNGNHLRNKCSECEYWDDTNYVCCSYNTKEATALYNAGYRKQEWHKVSEELPETSGLYIVCTDKGSVFTAHYYADCGRFNAPFKKSVVRWTEMPEAPR